MKKSCLSLTSLILLTTFLSCNQGSKLEVAKSIQESKSEFKDSTSFLKGVKVFIIPLASMKVIENVEFKGGKHYYLVGGKQYEAKELKSLD